MRMTDEEKKQRFKELTRSNFAAQMESLGYGPDGMPTTREPQPGALAPYIENFGKYLVQMAQMVQELKRQVEQLKAERVTAITISHADVKGINFRIREKADAVAKKYGITDAPGIRKIRADIRKNLLTAYGIRDFHDMPVNALAGAWGRIDHYANIRLIMKIKTGNGSG